MYLYIQACSMYPSLSLFMSKPCYSGSCDPVKTVRSGRNAASSPESSGSSSVRRDVAGPPLKNFDWAKVFLWGGKKQLAQRRKKKRLPLSDQEPRYVRTLALQHRIPPSKCSRRCLASSTPWLSWRRFARRCCWRKAACVSPRRTVRSWRNNGSWSFTVSRVIVLFVFISIIRSNLLQSKSTLLHAAVVFRLQHGRLDNYVSVLHTVERAQLSFLHVVTVMTEVKLSPRFPGEPWAKLIFKFLIGLWTTVWATLLQPGSHYQQWFFFNFIICYKGRVRGWMKAPPICSAHVVWSLRLAH